MPPTTTGTSPAPCSAEPVEDVRNELHVRARQDRDADEVDVLGQRPPRSGQVSAGCPGRPPQSRRPCPHRDLLGTVAVAVQTGLATSTARAPSAVPRTSRTARSSSLPLTPTEPETPVGARNSPNSSRRACAHSPGRVTPARAASSEAAMRFVPTQALRTQGSDRGACARSRLAASASPLLAPRARHGLGLDVSGRRSGSRRRGLP